MSMSPALRKAAILISALDSASADRLLDQMGEQQAALVRSAIMQLDDVEDAEQDAILAEFFGPTSTPSDLDESTTKLHHDQGVELQLSHTPENVAQPAGPRFGFLQEARGDLLAGRLRTEHPQLIALVVSHLPAEKSAELLRHLVLPLQREVLARLEELDDAEPEIILELERELARMFTRVQPRLASGKRQEQIQAIRERLQGLTEVHPVATPVVRKVPQLNQPQPVCKPQTPAASKRIAQFNFEQLLSLPGDDFFAVFDEADPRLVLLALAGAPRRMFERYVGQFEASRALEFERHLEQLRPLRLRDVDAAQRELAQIAGRRLQAAKTAAESSRRFAAAA